MGGGQWCLSLSWQILTIKVLLQRLQTDGYGRFCYRGKCGAAPRGGFVSGDEVSALVDSTHCGNDIGKVLEKAEPLPIEFTEETFFVLGFVCKNGGANLVTVE